MCVVISVSATFPNGQTFIEVSCSLFEVFSPIKPKNPSEKPFENCITLVQRFKIDMFSKGFELYFGFVTITFQRLRHAKAKTFGCYYCHFSFTFELRYIHFAIRIATHIH